MGLELPAGFTCHPAATSGASTSRNASSFCLLFAYVVNLKDITTKWENLLLLDFGVFSPLIWVQILHADFSAYMENDDN